MKAMSKQVQSARARMEAEQREKEYQEWFESLTDEEKEKHLAEKKASAKRGERALLNLMAMNAAFNGPYSKI